MDTVPVLAWETSVLGDDAAEMNTEVEYETVPSEDCRYPHPNISLSSPSFNN